MSTDLKGQTCWQWLHGIRDR